MIQSSLHNMRFFGTLCISNLKLARFGLTNNFVALPMPRLEQMTFCVISSAVPVNAKIGVPTERRDNDS